MSIAKLKQLAKDFPTDMGPTTEYDLRLGALLAAIDALPDLDVERSKWLEGDRDVWRSRALAARRDAAREIRALAPRAPETAPAKSDDPLCVCTHRRSQHDMTTLPSKCGVSGCACGPGCIHDGFVDVAKPSEPCATCGGSGADLALAPTCNECDGSGFAR